MKKDISMEDKRKEYIYKIREELIKEGPKVIKLLIESFDLKEFKISRKNILYILKNIKYKLNEKEQLYYESYICPNCLNEIKNEKIYLSDMKKDNQVDISGCFDCEVYSGFMKRPKKIVLIIDSHFKKADRIITSERDNKDNIVLMKINWFKEKKLFLFDEVEINNASDRDIERFLILVNNDIDEIRKERYKLMICIVNKKCAISDNTKKILDNTFGNVEYYTDIIETKS